MTGGKCKFQEFYPQVRLPSCLFLGRVCNFGGEGVPCVPRGGFLACDSQSFLSLS